MAGETFNHSDGVTLKEHFDDKLERMERSLYKDIQAQADKNAVEHRLNQIAIDKAEKTMNSHLDLMSSSTAIIKSALDAMDIRVAALKSLADVAAGKASQTSVIIATVGGLIGILLGLINLLKDGGL